MKTENIKFKAKRLDNGEWEKGSLVVTDLIGWDEPMAEIVTTNGMRYEVDHSTVCQFTGLKDCKGNEVWEGDMLSNVTNDSPDGIVVFKYGAFCLLAKNGRDFCVALTYLLSEKESLNRFKVIGNKFDKERMSLKKKEEMKKETFDFSEALKRMRKGKLVKRENGLYPFGIDEEGIFYHYGHHIFKVERMSSEDILAIDWEEV